MASVTYNTKFVLSAQIYWSMDSTCDLEVLIDLLVEINLSSHNYKESMVIFTLYRRFVIRSASRHMP